MSVIICDEIIEQHANESWLRYIDLTDWLRKPVNWARGQATAVTLTGTPTIVDTASVLTLASKTVNSADIIPSDDPDPKAIVLTSQAIQFRVSGGVAGTLYTIRGTVSDTDGNTLVVEAQLQVT